MQGGALAILGGVILAIIRGALVPRATLDRVVRGYEDQVRAAERREAEWRAVYEQFVATKVQCGEPTEGFTYDKFRQTLIKNQEALVTRHGAAEVKFSVYVKEGRAALKASPVR